PYTRSYRSEGCAFKGNCSGSTRCSSSCRGIGATEALCTATHYNRGRNIALVGEVDVTANCGYIKYQLGICLVGCVQGLYNARAYQAYARGNTEEVHYLTSY